MTPQLIITTEGQEIVGPSARHFISHIPGKTALAVSGYLRWMEIVDTNGLHPTQRLEAYAMTVSFCDRRKPRRMKTAFQVAEFWLN